jgi:DNA-binding response OmpR family regulator
MPKIMLVEDDPTMLSLLQTFLQMEGFEVVNHTDHSIDSILSLMHAERPSLALVDVHIHQVNGLDLLKRIRHDPELQHIPVIMSSGMDFSYQCLQAGANRFIQKPYMPDELIKAVRQVLST